MELCAIVQHHPSRAGLLPALLERLAPLQTSVVLDPQPDSEWPSPWRSYRACLEAVRDGDATHALIIQDDAMPCRDFAAALPTIIEAAQRFTNADPIIALAMYDESDVDNRSWIDEVVPPDAGATAFVHPIATDTMVPVIAAIWPRAAAEALLAVEPATYMGYGTIPNAPPGPAYHPMPLPVEGPRPHWYGSWIFVDRERWLSSDYSDLDEITVGRWDKHEHIVINRHRDVLPPVVEILPALVSHQDRGSVHQPGAEHRRVVFPEPAELAANVDALQRQKQELEVLIEFLSQDRRRREGQPVSHSAPAENLAAQPRAEARAEPELLAESRDRRLSEDARATAGNA